MWGTGLNPRRSPLRNYVNVPPNCSTESQEDSFTGGGLHLGTLSPGTAGLCKSLCTRKRPGAVKEREAGPEVGS